MAGINPIEMRGLGLQTPEISAREMRQPLMRPAEPGRSFQEVLADTVSEVQRLQDDADITIKQVVSGEITDVAEAMVAVERADVAFQTMMTVRNRVLTAYEEIMRMQI